MIAKHTLLLTVAASFLTHFGAQANDIDPAIETSYVALKAVNPIELDGELSEWAGANVIENPRFSIPKGSDDGENLVSFEELGGDWTGPEDHTASVQVVYDDENVYLGVVVTDEYHENSANSAWNGDSLQAMITNEDRDVQVGRYNYALGGVEGALAAVIIMHEAGPGGTDAVVTRDSETVRTTYEICLPKEALQLDELAEGVQFGLGFAINDGDEDTPGQKGWSGLGPHVVVHGKTPSEAALITLGGPIPPPLNLPLAWYPFDDTAEDGTGNGHDGAVEGANTEYVAGKFGNAIFLTGDNGDAGYVEIPDADELEFPMGKDFTIMTWYKTDAVENDQGLVSKGYGFDPRSPDGYYQLQTRGGGFTLDSRCCAGGTPRLRLDAGGNHGDDQWHHFTVVRDYGAGEIRLYVDGVLSADIVINEDNGGDWNMGVNDEVLAIGNHFNRYTRGAFDDVALWDSALTPDQIAQAIAEGVQSFLAAPPLDYQDAVTMLNPSFYYELNETDTTNGAADSTGNAAAPGQYNGDYDNGAPMVGVPGPIEVFGGIAVPGVGGDANLAHLSNNGGHITLGDGEDYGANAMTVALFIKAGQGAQGGDRIFTNNLEDPTKSFQMNIGNNGLVLAVDPNETGVLAERTLYLEDNSDRDRSFLQEASGWFHVVASTEGADGEERAANLRLWVNGVDRTDNLMPDVVGWGINTGMAKIGGRRDNPTDTTTHSGGQDEVAIWLNRVLTETEVQSLWQAAINPPREPAVGLPFQIDSITLDAAGKVTLVWPSSAGETFAIEASANLQAPWEEVITGHPSGGDMTTFEHNPVAGTRELYYRVRRE